MIPVNEPLFIGKEKQYLTECIETGWISSEGPFVERFENEFAKRTGRKYAIAVANGTAALQLAVEALDIGPGDEVILPALTIISCAAAIVRAGATPVPVDCDKNSWNITPEIIEQHITPRTRAIIVVHTYGLPVEIDRIEELANQYNIDIIEDAAHVHGLAYKNRPCGSFGKLSIFSFYSNKIITTGEGGMVLTDDKDISDQVRSLMNLCFQPGKRFIHEKLGWNYRMSNMQAAVGVAQLERLDDYLSIKRRIGALYQELLKDITCIQLPLKEFNGCENIYWVFGIVLNKDLEIDGQQLIQKLADEGIGSRPFFWPIHKQPVFTRGNLFKDCTNPVAEELAIWGIYIPCGMAITEEQQNVVSQKLHKILK